MESDYVFLRRIASFLTSKLVVFVIKLVGKDYKDYDRDRLLKIANFLSYLESF